jgi:hypothetical protein
MHLPHNLIEEARQHIDNVRTNQLDSNFVDDLAERCHGFLN